MTQEQGRANNSDLSDETFSKQLCLYTHQPRALQGQPLARMRCALSYKVSLCPHNHTTSSTPHHLLHLTSSPLLKDQYIYQPNLARRHAHNARLWPLTIFAALALTTTACKCRRPDGSVLWDASYACCPFYRGWWVKKDCRVPDHQFFVPCCKDHGGESDC
jgi:hypothetical protein